MALVKLRALGLREVVFSDNDYYLTALAEDGRKIEILCRNARRAGKEVPAARQFCYAEFVLSERGGKYALREADSVHSFFGLTADITRYALACYLAELTASLSGEEQQPAFCRLLLGALYALETGKRDPSLVKAAFEWRIMAESGYAPNLTQCGICGQPIGQPPLWFSIPAAQAAHAACAARVGGWDPLIDAALRAICHALNATVTRVSAFYLSGPARGQFCTLAEQYVLYRLERSFDSLKFYHSLDVPPSMVGKKETP